jgi:CYTH domain-containing protein
MEIEKKYKLDKLPDNLGEGLHIIQGYLFSGENELRLRKKGDKYLLTYKSGGTLSRKELEIGIPKWLFNVMWPLTRGRVIEKIRRFRVLPNGLKLEFDEYLGALKGLMILEVEFADEDFANDFILPEYIRGVDVTSDMNYKNKNLALYGCPRQK